MAKKQKKTCSKTRKKNCKPRAPASPAQRAQRGKFASAFKTCREDLASGHSFGKCMKLVMGGKKKRKSKKR